MSFTLHHSKRSSQPLPYIPKKGIELNSSKNNIHEKILDHKLQRMQLRHFHSQKNSIHMNDSSDNLLIDHKNILKRVNSNQGFQNIMHVPEKYLDKNKKYYRVDAKMKTKQNVVKCDLQNIIQCIVKEKQQNDKVVSNLRKNFIQQKKLINHRFAKNFKSLREEKLQNQSKIKKTILNNSSQEVFPRNCINSDIFTSNFNQINFFTRNSALVLEMKQLKKQLKHYISKLKAFLISKQSSQHISTFDSPNKENKFNYDNKFKRLTINKSNHFKVSPPSFSSNCNNFHKEYVKLSQQSHDIIQYFLKSQHLKFGEENANRSNGFQQDYKYNKEQIQKVLKSSDKKLILSVLKSTYKCFQSEFNVKQVISRIILSLNINPLNDFQFISESNFIKIRKLMTLQCQKKQMKQFMLKYFLLEKQTITKVEFNNILFSLFNKLKQVVNLPTIQNIFQRFFNIEMQLLKQYEQLINNENRLTHNINNKCSQNFASLKNHCSKQINQLNQKQNHLNEYIQNQNNVQQQKQSSNSVLYKQKIKWLLNIDPMFLWEEILQLIFNV